jgi:hypothetical protein
MGQRSAEYVGEQQQENDRLQRHVQELFERMDHLEHVPLGEHQRVPRNEPLLHENLAAAA